MGKTSILKSLSLKYNVKFTDYDEMTKTSILRGDFSAASSILFEMLRHEKMGKEEEGLTFCDRSPLTNLLYRLVKEEYDCEGKGMKLLDRYLIDDDIKALFTKDKVFYLMPLPCLFETILEQMIKRDNGIDLMDINYIKAQYRIFSHLKTYDFPNFYFNYCKTSYLSKAYFDQILCNLLEFANKE